jgi:hypothetical protein
MILHVYKHHRKCSFLAIGKNDRLTRHNDLSHEGGEPFVLEFRPSAQFLYPDRVRSAYKVKVIPPLHCGDVSEPLMRNLV